MEFYGEFQDLCESSLITYCIISQGHLEANMLVEWMVQMIKRGLRKYQNFKKFILKIGINNYHG